MKLVICEQFFIFNLINCWWALARIVFFMVARWRQNLSDVRLKTCAVDCVFSVSRHSRPQRPRSFWSAPRIATSGQVQRHSGFKWICKRNRLRPELIRFVKLDSEHAQSDGKSVNRGLPLLDLARGRDSWCWPKGVQPLGTRMVSGHSGVPVNARGNGDRFGAVVMANSASNQGHDKWMSLIACGSIHEVHELFSDDSRRKTRYLCVWLLCYVINFAHSR